MCISGFPDPLPEFGGSMAFPIKSAWIPAYAGMTASKDA
jgi:hypothetical protein